MALSLKSRFHWKIFWTKRKQWVSEKGLRVFSLFNPKDPFESVDVMIESPVSFDRAYKNKEIFSLGDFKIKVISIKDLFVMKESAGRDKDKMDIKELKHVLEIRREKRPQLGK